MNIHKLLKRFTMFNFINLTTLQKWQFEKFHFPTSKFSSSNQILEIKCGKIFTSNHSCKLLSNQVYNQHFIHFLDEIYACCIRSDGSCQCSR